MEERRALNPGQGVRTAPHAQVQVLSHPLRYRYTDPTKKWVEGVCVPSCLDRLYRVVAIAQWIERSSSIRRVAGSNPAGDTWGEAPASSGGLKVTHSGHFTPSQHYQEAQEETSLVVDHQWD